MSWDDGKVPSGDHRARIIANVGVSAWLLSFSLDIVDISFDFVLDIRMVVCMFALSSIGESWFNSIPWLSRGMRHQLTCIDYGNI